MRTSSRCSCVGDLVGILADDKRHGSPMDAAIPGTSQTTPTIESQASFEMTRGVRNPMAKDPSTHSPIPAYGATLPVNRLGSRRSTAAGPSLLITPMRASAGVRRKLGKQLLDEVLLVLGLCRVGFTLLSDGPPVLVDRRGGAESYRSHESGRPQPHRGENRQGVGRSGTARASAPPSPPRRRGRCARCCR